MDPSGDAQRIDKWLWHARIVKTRTLASQLALSGRVRLNRRRIGRASQPVRPGDVITLALHGRVRVYRVVEIAGRRGPASVAQTLYEDLSPPVPAKTAPSGPPEGPAGQRPPGSGRPTKKDRRALKVLLNR